MSVGSRSVLRPGCGFSVLCIIIMIGLTGEIEGLDRCVAMTGR